MDREWKPLRGKRAAQGRDIADEIAIDHIN